MPPISRIGKNLKTIVLLLSFYVMHAKSEEPDAKMYFAIAALPNQTYGRVFNRTLANITQTFLSKKVPNVVVDTLSIDLPENGSFTAEFLENLCDTFEKKHVVAAFVIGDFPAAFTVNTAAEHIGFPVLWAKGHSELLPGFRSLATSPLEIQLAPTGRELVSALRGLLLHAHWHTFTVLADPQSATALRGPDLWPILRAQPLHPNLITLSTPLRAQTLFRKLADISRSTRGVVVLLSDKPSAVRILEDAKRLNMMDGHFVWLWIDTSANISFRNSSDDEKDQKEPKKIIEDRLKRSASMVDLHQANANYMLRNDKFLLLNKGGPVFDNRQNKSPPKTQKADKNVKSELPSGLLHLRPLPIKIDRHLVKGAVRLLTTALKAVLDNTSSEELTGPERKFSTSCWRPMGEIERYLAQFFGRELRAACTNALAGQKFTQEIGVDKVDKSLVANFEILNLVPERSLKETDLYSNRTEIYSNATQNVKWKRVGLVSGRSVRLDTIVWPGGDLSVAAVSSRARTAFRVVTALSPPFVMESELDEDGQCLRGLPCHRVLTSDKDNLTLVFNEMRRLEDEEEEKEETLEENKSSSDYKQFNVEYDDERENFPPFQKFKYRTNCCYGLSMDLLENIAQELGFDFRLYIVADGLYGSKTAAKKSRQKRDIRQKFLNFRLDKNDIYEEEEQDLVERKWNGIVGDIVSGAAHMSFAALSVSSARSEVMDFSSPYFYGGVSFVAAPQQKSEIPLLAFLLPFSTELWITIFMSLNVTAIAVAIYEWLSPFGLNPWGRQRSKNFSLSSALWVMWGLLCGHLVAFKAPKSWPNKFLINVWGGFSVIFVASYTANIAALIAGLFFQNTVSNYHDRGLLNQRVGAPKSSAAEYYVQKTNPHLWHHMHRYGLSTIEEGIDKLRNGSLDLIIADTSILDYYRATDHGCKLQKIGDDIIEDTYAIGMSKGFPLKDSISAVIAKYSNNGYMDILQEKWYGGLPCFKLATDIVQPRPLGVRAVTGVFILLGVGMTLGLVILLLEHLFFRYTLPLLREKPKDSVWRSRNIMFFSQKLYRFINCVELVSPHHAARELVHTIRQGQITSLFQKSIKRKEHEQRRRRKSKAQFFEMIQEIRSTLRRQQEEREPPLESVTEVDSEEHSSPDEKKSRLSPSLIKRTFMRSSPKSDGNKAKSPTSYFSKHQLFSPRSRNKTKSSTNLNVRRFSTDSILNSPSGIAERSSLVGRRLSRDASSFLTSSPPDINSRRSSYLDVINSGSKLSVKSPVLSIENVSDTSSKSMEPIRKLSDSESIGKKLATLPKYKEVIDKHMLHPQHHLIGKSNETLTTKIEVPKVTTAKSFTNLTEPKLQQKAFSDEETGNKVQVVDRRLSAPKMEDKPSLSDEEITRRSHQTMSQLKKELCRKSPGKQRDPKKDNNARNLVNPLIKIQIDDTSMECAPNMSKRHRMRHKSLGEVIAPEIAKRKQVTEQSHSLDNPKQLVKQNRIPRSPKDSPKTRRKLRKKESLSPESGGTDEISKPRRMQKRDSLSPDQNSFDNYPKTPQRPTTLQKRDSLSPESKESRQKRGSLSPDKESRSGRVKRDDDLPPAPPPPNCSPRNSNGRSPLERLSKDELVLLWRSSESELRSHLLKAIRGKEEENHPP